MPHVVFLVIAGRAGRGCLAHADRSAGQGPPAAKT
jgi:hypothetical protein